MTLSDLRREASQTNWRPWTWKDIAGLLFVILFVGGICCVDAFYPLRKINWGFGPEWSCGGVTGSALACTNKPDEQHHRSN